MKVLAAIESNFNDFEEKMQEEIKNSGWIAGAYLRILSSLWKKKYQNHKVFIVEKEEDKVQKINLPSGLNKTVFLDKIDNLGFVRTSGYEIVGQFKETPKYFFIFMQ